MVDNKDIKQNLINLGLSEQEAECFIVLSSGEDMSVYEISKAINIPRSTVYRLCENLVEKKFAEWIIGDRGQRIKVKKPSQLKFILNDKKTEIENIENSLQYLESNLLEHTSNVPKTQVRYYQGKDGIKQIMWNALKADKETLGYSIFGRAEVVGKNFSELYTKEFEARKLKDRVIINPEQVTRFNEFAVHSLHKTPKNVRVIDNKLFYVSGDTLIYNNVYAISFWKHGEVVGVEIENPEIAKVQKGIFETLWRIAKPLEISK